MQKNIINVLFNANKGVVALLSKEAVTGEKLGKLPKVVRNGYTFDGWFLGSQRVDENTIIEAEDDITLTAKWTKQKNVTTVHDLYHKQIRGIIVLAVLVVLLVVTLLVVNKVVGVTVLSDTYTDADGVEHTDKYYIRSTNGEFVLYDSYFGGNQLEVNEDGYYIATNSGNQYDLDAETGDCELYAVVDYDAEGGELLGYSSRIMMFPQIRQTYVHTITVENEYGTYTLYRDESGAVQVKGFEDNSFIAYDKELYAYLCVSCGYTLTMRKIDFSSDQAPRKSDGTIDYSAYGLDDPQATYTIKGALVDEEGNYSIDESNIYTVQVGDAILSGAGYYVKMIDRDAVYILDDDLATTVLQPVETMVTAIVTYPVSMASYPMGQNFTYAKIATGEGETVDLEKLAELMAFISTTGIGIQFNDDEYKLTEDLLKEALKQIDEDTEYTEEKKKELKETTEKIFGYGKDGIQYMQEESEIIASFTYQDLSERNYTMNSSFPYQVNNELMDGYYIDDNAATDIFYMFYSLEVVNLCKIGFTIADLKEYGFDHNVSYIGYTPPLIDSSDETNTVYYSDELYNMVLISNEPNENGNYYIASFLSQMIVEVDPYYVSFIDSNYSDWYNSTIFSLNISYLDDMTLQIGEKNISLHFDNSKSYYYTVEDDEGNDLNYQIFFGTTNPSYYMEDGEPNFTVGSANLVIYYCTDGVHTDFYGDGYDKTTDTNSYFTKLDYTIVDEYLHNSGQLKTKTYTGVQNFRYLYQELLTLSIMEDVNEKEFETNMGKTVEEYLATETPDALIEYSAEDRAMYLNPDNYDENNTRHVIYRFYQYTDQKYLLTVETLEEGETPDATTQKAKFYVLGTPLDKIATDIDNLLNQKLIDRDSKY